MTCAGDKPPKPFPARSLCRSDRSSPARSKIVARNRSDLEPPAAYSKLYTKRSRPRDRPTEKPEDDYPLRKKTHANG